MKPKRSQVVMRDDRKQILDIREHLDLAVPAVNSKQLDFRAPLPQPISDESFHHRKKSVQMSSR